MKFANSLFANRKLHQINEIPIPFCRIFMYEIDLGFSNNQFNCKRCIDHVRIAWWAYKFFPIEILFLVNRSNRYLFIIGNSNLFIEQWLSGIMGHILIHCMVSFRAIVWAFINAASRKFPLGKLNCVAKQPSNINFNLGMRDEQFCDNEFECDSAQPQNYTKHFNRFFFRSLIDTTK